MPDRVPQPKLNWLSLAEQRIREAQAEGEFDNLPGFGKPIPGIDEPHDELWWVKDKLRREEICSLPPALALRLDVQKTRERVERAVTEEQVRQEISALNERISRSSLAGVWGPAIDVQPIDLDEAVAHWRATQLSAG